MVRLFVPGFGARASFYRDALGDGWSVHDPPAFRSGAGFNAHVDALHRRLEASEQPLTLAGHSLGAAAAIVATARAPGLVAQLLLIAPAGLPLTKPLTRSLRDLRDQARNGVYPRGELRRALLDALAAPVSALRLARAVRALDLRGELEQLRHAGVPCDVVACVGDTLTPVEHCRRVADLSGARFREITARGGHMWMVVDPTTFAPLVH